MSEHPPLRVFVDAKIIDRPDKSLPKRTLVAYIVEGSDLLRGAREVEGVDETDEAELAAVAFAIRELKGKLGKFTIICDHDRSSLKSFEAKQDPDQDPYFQKNKRREGRTHQSTLNGWKRIQLTDY